MVSIFNFLLISYRLFIEYIPFLQSIFTSLLIYVIFAVVVIPPIVTFIGYLHRTRQLETDQQLMTERNPIIMDMKEKLENIEKMVKEIKERKT